MELAQFIEDKLRGYADQITDESAKVHEHALGEMTFFMALRRVLAKRGTAQDLGMMDAINDTLQEKGIIEKGATFLK